MRFWPVALFTVDPAKWKRKTSTETAKILDLGFFFFFVDPFYIGPRSLFVYRLWFCHAICNTNRYGVAKARARALAMHQAMSACAMCPINFHWTLYTIDGIMEIVVWIVRFALHVYLSGKKPFRSLYFSFVFLFSPRFFFCSFQIKSFHKFSIKLIRYIRIYYPIDDLHCHYLLSSVQFDCI